MGTGLLAQSMQMISAQSNAIRAGEKTESRPRDNALIDGKCKLKECRKGESERVWKKQEVRMQKQRMGCCTYAD